MDTQIEDVEKRLEALRQLCVELRQKMSKYQIAAQAARLREDDDDAFWFEREYLAARNRYESIRATLLAVLIDKLDRSRIIAAWQNADFN